MPLCGIVPWLSWPFVVLSWQQHEVSASAGGLLRWPIKAAIPLGFGFLGMQALAEAFRRMAFLRGDIQLDTHYERPLQ